MLFTEIPQSMTTHRQFPPLSYMYKQDQGSRAPSNAGHWREIIFDPKKVDDANVCQKKKFNHIFIGHVRICTESFNLR